MEIFLSKRTIIKAVLLGLLMTFAAFLIAAKVIFDLAGESVLSEFSMRDIFSYVLGLVGVAGFLIFGTTTLVFISRLFQTAPQVIITFEGIEDKRLSCGLINWDEIELITLEETKYAQWLNLILKSPEKFYRRLSSAQIFLRKLNGQKGNNNFRIGFTDLDKPIDVAWEFIEDKIIKPRAEKGIYPMP